MMLGTLMADSYMILLWLSYYLLAGEMAGGAAVTMALLSRGDRKMHAAAIGGAVLGACGLILCLILLFALTLIGYSYVGNPAGFPFMTGGF